MTIDLTLPAHREAMAAACHQRIDAPGTARAMALAARTIRDSGARLIPEFAADLALSEPPLAAEALRGMLEWMGVEALPTSRGTPAANQVQVWPHDTRAGDDRGGQWVMLGHASLVDAVPMAKLPALFLALLAIPEDEDAPKRRELALAALRGAS